MGTPPPPPKIVGATKKRRDSLVAPDFPNFRQEQRPSTSSTASDSAPPVFAVSHVDSACQALPPPTIITSSVTPPATSPTAPKGRRDSTTQCGRVTRRDSRASPERAPRLSKLQRQVMVKIFNSFSLKLKKKLKFFRQQLMMNLAFHLVVGLEEVHNQL